ncbi:hypothetical protein BJ138DRAFT_968943, partial [Hygrophoropsis aurantiaca]
EERIQAAIAAINASGMKPNGATVLSIRRAAQDFDVPRATLQARYNGRQSREQAHEHKQKLTTAQELVLVEWIKTMGRRGMPLNAQAIIDYASDV